MAARERVLGFLGWLFIRALYRTVRVQHVGDAPLRERERARQSTIYCFWHRHLLLMIYSYRGRGISVLSSQHRDGEVMAQALSRLGMDVTRGSTTRGGMAALRALLRKARAGYDLAFTPDGPRGPAREVKPGVIHAALMGEMPIQPIAIAASRARSLASWDRFLVPLPFSRVVFVYGELLAVHPGDDLDTAARELERRLNDVEARAEELARGGR